MDHARFATPAVARPRPAALARGISNLMELLKDGMRLVIGDTDTRVPDFDAQLPAAASAAQNDFTSLRIFERVAEQIADHLFEQPWIGLHNCSSRQDMQR